MVGVMVAQADRVDVAEPGVPLQRAHGTVPEIEQEPEAVGLEQVTGRGAVGTGK